MPGLLKTLRQKTDPHGQPVPHHLLPRPAAAGKRSYGQCAEAGALRLLHEAERTLPPGGSGSFLP